MSPTPESLERPLTQTKIVATVGPACSGPEALDGLIAAGVNVFRLNTAHGDRDSLQDQLDVIRHAESRAERPIGVLVDLAGPKIRLGALPGGQMECVTGQTIRFVHGEASRRPGDLTTTYETLIDELQGGNRVVLADGTVGLVVEQIDQAGAVCRIVQGGLIRDRQGVNLPGVRLSVPSLSERDRENAVWAAEAGADFVGLSFVRAASDVRQLKELLAANGSDAHVIAKIEKPEAVDHLDEIVQAADGVMVARGDLGVEIDIAEVPTVQKRIITTCQRYLKPVIVATQMLDSMQHSRLPTRAEANDVATAILDGADACMLSGETAIGKYPREAVEMMHRIALATEPIYRERQPKPLPEFSRSDIHEITQGTVYAAGRLAEVLNAKLLVVATHSGATARCISNNRHFVPTVGVSDLERSLRRMALYWGVHPLAGSPTDKPDQTLAYVVDRARKAGYLSEGDRVVLVSGTGLRVSRHNVLMTHEVD